MKKLFLNGLKTLLTLAFLSSPLAGQAYTEERRGPWFISGSYLLMNVREDNLIYANRVFNPDLPANPGGRKYDIKRVEYKWDSAFRLAGGYRSIEDEWKIAAEWTHFNTKARSDVDAPNIDSLTILDSIGVYFETLPEIPSFTTPYSFAKANTKLDIDWVDLSLSKTFHPSNRFWMEPEMGVRGLRLEKKHHTSALLRTTSTFDYRYKSPIYGYGLEMALKSGYHFDCGISLESLFGGAVLYGQSTLKESYVFDRENFIPSVLEGYTKTRLRYCVPMLDLSITLRYELYFYCKQLFLHAGWEQHTFFEVFQGRTGNLTLSGLNLGATLVF